MRWTAALAGAVALSLFAGAAVAAPPRPPFVSGRVGFTLVAGGEAGSLALASAFVLPNADLTLEAKAPSGHAVRLTASEGVLTAQGERRWSWRAPASPGARLLTAREETTGEEIALRVFVMVPAAEIRDGKLRGYTIGAYPKKPLKGLSIYLPPKGFVEVTAENADLPVSPHFRLGQFVCKQAGGYPKYLVLRARLLSKLETLLALVNERGYRCDTFFVMSGYRTPSYNRAIGNVDYSRHMWGGAADIFIDEDGDGVIDDLNRDGKVTLDDARVLYNLVEKSSGQSWYSPFIGGLGLYDRTSEHGPFVHVDVRGTRARWGP